jgi:hypothetical protein
MCDSKCEPTADVCRFFECACLPLRSCYNVKLSPVILIVASYMREPDVHVVSVAYLPAPISCMRVSSLELLSVIAILLPCDLVNYSEIRML